MGTTERPDEGMTCPDCGRSNDAGRDHCAHCNFPFHGPAAADSPAGLPHADDAASVPGAADALTERPGAEGQAAAPSERAAESPIVIPPPPRLERLRQKRVAGTQPITLWLFVAVLAAASLVFIAVKANVDRISEPVEGARKEQQQRADDLRAVIARDSTNVDARIALGDVLYDTGNWSDAIIEYRSAVRQDSSRAMAITDLGVCYYSLGLVDEAEKHFRLALVREPQQTIALFNMGILSERRGDPEAALKWYHSALQSNPDERVKEVVVNSLARVQQATGRQAPPLPDGR